MQQESNAKKSKLSVISLESIGSNLSNFSYLKENQGALNRQSYKQSLKSCMSIQSDKKSDLYEKMISEEGINRNPVYGSGLSKNFKPESEGIKSGGIRRSYDGRYFDSDVTNKATTPNSIMSNESANSMMEQYRIMHTCLCIQYKCQKDCPCYEATNDECVFGICCRKCIESKNRLLQTKKKLQQQGIENLDDLKPCTCKKTKCNKKYCACYAARRKCTNMCQCDSCTNCNFYDYQPPEQPKQTTYIELEYDRRVQMPQTMDFEPVQFPEL